MIYLLIVKGPNDKNLKKTTRNSYKIVAGEKLITQKWQSTCQKRLFIYLFFIRSETFFKPYKTHHFFFFSFFPSLVSSLQRDHLWFFFSYRPVKSGRKWIKQFLNNSGLTQPKLKKKKKLIHVYLFINKLSLNLNFSHV